MDHPKEKLFMLMILLMLVFYFMNKKTKEVLINIGTGKDMTIKQYVELFLQILIPNKKIKIIYDKSKPNGTLEKLMDVSLAKKYGWKSKTKLNDAIFKTYDDYCMLKKINKIKIN